MLWCKKKKPVSQAKKNTVHWFMASTHPSPSPPPPYPIPRVKPPKTGFWQQIVPQKTTKFAKKHLKLKKKKSNLFWTNPSTCQQLW